MGPARWIMISERGMGRGWRVWGRKASFSCFHRPGAVAAAASRATQFASTGRLLCANYLLSLSKELSNAQIFAAPFLLCLPHTPSPFGITCKVLRSTSRPVMYRVSSRRLEKMSSSFALITFVSVVNKGEKLMLFLWLTFTVRRSIWKVISCLLQHKISNHIF